jgi:hypothetical protein
LELGEVHDIAGVILNGRPAGVAWKRPHVVDITGAARPGRNQLEVRVTNRLVNRMLPLTPLPLPYAPLREYVPEPVTSGLLGPVRIRPARIIMLTESKR